MRKVAKMAISWTILVIWLTATAYIYVSVLVDSIQRLGK